MQITDEQATRVMLALSILVELLGDAERLEEQAKIEQLLEDIGA